MKSRTKKLLLLLGLLLTVTLVNPLLTTATEQDLITQESVDGVAAGASPTSGCATGSFVYKTLVKIPGLGSPNDSNTNDVTICPNSLGNFLKVAFNYVIGIAIALAVVMIIYGGVLYATTDAISGKSEGKKVIQDAAYGLALALGSYLILVTINPDLIEFDLKIGTVQLQGLEAGGQGAVTVLEVLPNGELSSSGGAGSGGGGTCTPSTNPNNACSVAQLSRTCFASRAQAASSICMLESGGGRTGVSSGSDKTDYGRGASYSVGLWQINLTVHRVADLNCPAAFSGPCGRGTATSNRSNPVGGPGVGNCKQTITDRTLYNQCVTAAQNPVNSTAVACRIYGSNQSFAPWAYSANRCNVPKRL